MNATTIYVQKKKTDIVIKCTQAHMLYVIDYIHAYKDIQENDKTS